jgi:hypothetical protein
MLAVADNDSVHNVAARSLRNNVLQQQHAPAMPLPSDDALQRRSSPHDATHAQLIQEAAAHGDYATVLRAWDPMKEAQLLPTPATTYTLLESLAALVRSHHVNRVGALQTTRQTVVVRLPRAHTRHAYARVCSWTRGCLWQAH